MYFGLRKIFIACVSLGMVIAIFLLYNCVSNTPPIESHGPPEFTTAICDGNIGRPGQKVGKIGDAEVETVRRAKYVTLDRNKQPEREFGFEELLHEDGDEWELRKPYITFFQDAYTCYVTSDKGTVRVENAPRGPSPRDARLIGNVVIRIVPEKSDRFKESTVYLDDVSFVGEKSQLSTAGPVKFVAEDAQLLGKGLELVYNSAIDRLEYLRITHLDSLRLRTAQGALFGAARTKADAEPNDAGRAWTKPPDSPIAADFSQKAGASPLPPPEATAQKQGEYYRLILSKNVLIDTPDQLVFADDKISINSIFWEKTSIAKPARPDANDTNQTKVPAPDAEKTIASARQKAEPPPETPADILVTCDNGILLAPMDFPRSITDFAPSGQPPVSTDSKIATVAQDRAGRTSLVSSKIDYSASTDNTVVAGPLTLTFDVNDPVASDPNAYKTPVPARVTAREQAKFLPASNQVIFEGDCLCTMLRQDANSRQKYALSAPTLIVNLSKDKPDQSSDAKLDHLTAAGGTVSLSVLKTAADGNSLGGVELKCARFDYDPAQPMYLATGPGVIKFDNSHIPQEPNLAQDRFSLKRPCWALVQDFDALKYLAAPNLIIADAGPRQMYIGYVPIVNGRYGRPIKAYAGHVEASLYEAADGRLELSTLTATDGFSYEDEDKEFEGGQLFYDTASSMVTAMGDDLQSCYFNGVAVDAIEWDLKTDSLNFEVRGPGALKLKE
ncbi:MAG TPA: hypothetical protein VMW16_15625 [Sedimentisphaerales bacterium]|nr:hypothetical protein [Sedimentisphaerales bacterium]